MTGPVGAGWPILALGLALLLGVTDAAAGTGRSRPCHQNLSIEEECPRSLPAKSRMMCLENRNARLLEHQHDVGGCQDFVSDNVLIRVLDPGIVWEFANTRRVVLDNGAAVDACSALIPAVREPGIAGSDAVVAVGLSSVEGGVGSEAERATARAEYLAECMHRAGIADRSTRAFELSLGKFGTEPGVRRNVASTAPQRRLIVVAIRGVGRMQEVERELRSAMARTDWWKEQFEEYSSWEEWELLPHVGPGAPRGR